MAFDATRGRIVLYGGQQGMSAVNDTWEFDGTHWTPVAAPVSPMGSAHALVWDGRREACLLFGGYAAGYADDTWEFDDTGWAERFPTATPPARAWHSMAYDELRARTLLFGGAVGTLVQAGDTWWFRYTSDWPAERCDNGSDDDDDGLADCADPDCQVVCASCGDAVCDAHESCGSCPSDCGACPALCGDSLCEPTEGCATCPGDCGSC
jgi:hypothetical protein